MENSNEILLDDALFLEELLIADVGTMICDAMHRHDLSRSELATRLGVSKSHITQVLRGKNISLRALARMMHAMGERARVVSHDSLSEFDVVVAPWLGPDGCEVESSPCLQIPWVLEVRPASSQVESIEDERDATLQLAA